MTNPLTLTKIARKASRSLGHTFSYTNKFDNCRTLKMYVEKDAPINQQMMTEIDAALRAAGSTDHSMKLLTGLSFGGYGYTSTSLIVRIPN